MKKKLFAAALAFALAGTANAATLVKAEVRGVTGAGAIYDTDPGTGFWTLFLMQPGLGNFLNPNDQALNASVTEGSNRFLLAGDGWMLGTTFDSDVDYRLNLTFSDGAVLSGLYTPTTNTFLGGTPTTVGGTTYSLTEFSFRRYLGDAVSPYVATPGNDGNDYSGNFTFSATTAPVPEPTTWALMLVGFGAVGYSIRSRPRRQLQAI